MVIYTKEEMAANPEIMPKELRYGLIPTMPQSRSYLFKQRSEYVEYDVSQGQTIEINIPRLQRTYLTKDSYLKFDMVFDISKTNVGTADAGERDYLAFDRCGVWGLFDRIEVYDYMGSTLLERISGVSDLMTLLMDTHATTDEMSNYFNILAGTNYGYIDVNTSTASNELARIQRVKNPNIGYIIHNKNTNTAVAGNSVVVQFSVPLFSFLGLLSSKFVPLHNGFTIKLVLNDPNYFLLSGTTDSVNTGNRYKVESVTVGNAEFAAQVLELGPVAEGLIMDSLGGQPVALHTKTFRLFKDVINGAYNSSPQSSFRLDLDLNVISLTNLLWLMKPLGYVTQGGTTQTPIPSNNLGFQQIGQRVRNYLQRWNFQYGSSYLPNVNGISAITTTYPTRKYATIGSRVGNVLETYVELLKSRHGWNTASHPTQIAYLEYFADKYNTLTQNFSDAGNINSLEDCPKFACGLDLELVSGKSSEVICGMNTNGLNTCINGWFNPENASANNSDKGTVDSLILAWAEYDAFVNIAPGVATTVSF